MTGLKEVTIRTFAPTGPRFDDSGTADDVIARKVPSATEARGVDQPTLSDTAPRSCAATLSVAICAASAPAGDRVGNSRVADDRVDDA